MNPKQSPWNNGMYVEAYKYARMGFTRFQIAKALGVSWLTFLRFCKRRKYFMVAIEAGKKARDPAENSTFRDYIYQRLPPDLKEVWDRINKCENSHDPYSMIEQVFDDITINQGRKRAKYVRQHLFLYALVDRSFNMSEAGKAVNVSMHAINAWKMNDKDFKRLLNEIEYHKGNFFEGGLVKLVAEGDTNAILFANKTFNRGRGYGTQVDINVSGGIEHKHTHVVNLEELALSLEVRKAIMEAVKYKEEQDKKKLELAKLEDKLTVDGSVVEDDRTPTLQEAQMAVSRTAKAGDSSHDLIHG